jgi:pyruvate/2-oxoglutarate dehydrogenase complex dihydrolipoamide acyltransferase (E2) component
MQDSFILEDLMNDITGDISVISNCNNFYNAMLEFDVTKSKNIMSKNKVISGKNSSFTTWLIKCISLAISESKWINQSELFFGSSKSLDKLDVCVLVDKYNTNNRVLVPYIIRDVENKRLKDISNELNSVNLEERVLIEILNFKNVINFYKVAKNTRRLILKYFLLKTKLIKEYLGNIMITSHSIIGSFNGWIIPNSIHPINFSIGKINEKPKIMKDIIKSRKILQMSVSIHKDIIEESQIDIFLSRLTHLIENAYGID